MAIHSPKTVVETGLITSNVQSRTASRTYICKVSAGSSVGKEIAVGARLVVLGSDATCDLVLDDPKVSRRHLELEMVPDGLRIKDLGSTNGTFLDGVRITEVVTGRSASIRCGGTTLRARPTPGIVVKPSTRERFGTLIGDSLPMREVFGVLERASPTEATILMQGESGTGKELAARAIHDHSPRAGGTFVVLDCTSTNPQLVESQLFGHVKGAFTGALEERKGAFVEAGKGTLFIDELGELPLAAQAKLLRALENRTVQPVGSDRPVQVDARVIAATHRDLSSMVDQGTFRGDLFHRLSIVHLVIPPLRERLEDLTCLVQGLYEARGLDPGPINGPNLEILSAHHWPGNVRELRNTIERAWVLGGEAPFRELQIWMGSSEKVPVEVVDVNLPFKDAKERWVGSFERRYLAAVFAMHDENVSQAARHAGINRNHFAKLLDEYGLRKR